MRWALQFQGQDFVVRCRSGLKDANADGLSRQALLFSKDVLVHQGEGLPGQKCTQDSSGPNKTISNG